MRIAYLITRVRWHEQIRVASGVPVDRAGLMLLRQLADRGVMRPGELAAGLGVEPPHITRQLQRLEKAGYIDRLPDPADRRAQLARLTPTGQDAAGQIRLVGRQAMAAALEYWPTEDLHQLATLFHRMVDDFMAHADASTEETSTGAGPRTYPGTTVGGG